MAFYYDQSALDALLDVIRQGATRVCLLSQYTQNDTYATVNGNVIAEGDAALDNTTTYFSASVAAGNDQRMTFQGANGTASVDDDGALGLHIALMSGSVVYAVTNETSNQAITNGNPVTFPAFYMQASQPVVAS